VPGRCAVLSRILSGRRKRASNYCIHHVRATCCNPGCTYLYLLEGTCSCWPDWHGNRAADPENNAANAASTCNTTVPGGGGSRMCWLGRGSGVRVAICKVWALSITSSYGWFCVIKS